jgi:hypothetical protein
MFLTVDNQHPWQQLNLMPEQPQRHRPGQKGRVHEYTLTVRHLIGHRLGLGKGNNDIRQGADLTGKRDLDIGNGEASLINREVWRPVSGIAKPYRPGPFARAQVFNPAIKNSIKNKRGQEGQEKMFARATYSHFPVQRSRAANSCQAEALTALIHSDALCHIWRNLVKCPEPSVIPDSARRHRLTIFCPTLTKN